MSTFALREASPNRLAGIAAVRHEAHFHNIDPDMAVELASWGNLDMISDNTWTLYVNNEGKQLTVVRFNGRMRSSMIESFTKDQSGQLLRTHMFPSIPATKAEIREVDTYDKEAGVLKKRFLLLICDFGIMGNLAFGISQEGNLSFQNNLKKFI